MAFCGNCGQQIDDEAVICPHCRAPQQNIGQGTAAALDSKPVVSKKFLVIVIIAVAVIIAAAFMILGNGKKHNELAVSCANNYLSEATLHPQSYTELYSGLPGKMILRVERSEPTLLDHKGNTYYVYFDLSFYFFDITNDGKPTGYIIVVKSDGFGIDSSDYQVIATEPVGDGEGVQNALERCKKLYAK